MLGALWGEKKNKQKPDAQFRLQCPLTLQCQIYQRLPSSDLEESDTHEESRRLGSPSSTFKSKQQAELKKTRLPRARAKEKKILSNAVTAQDPASQKGVHLQALGPVFFLASFPVESLPLMSNRHESRILFQASRLPFAVNLQAVGNCATLLFDALHPQKTHRALLQTLLR